MHAIWDSFKKGFKDYYFWLARVTPDWDFIKTFFKSPLFNVVALLPILGFLIVQIGTLTEVIADSGKYSEFIRMCIERIVGVYWGSYYYLTAYVVYLWGPPPMVRSSKDADDFLDYVQKKNTPRLTISLIFQAAESKALFGSSSKETEEFVDCVRNWIRRVLDLSEGEIDHTRETKYILGRISGTVEFDPNIQTEISTFRHLLLDLSVRRHKEDPWIQELNDNIGNIFYRENVRKPDFSRLVCLFVISLGTLHIFGSVILNHIKIASSY
ncbi:hypothetical protein [Hyphomonas pacifica]|uniref:Uncharacterized protein n=1 Tax=Hyphomonas pacifica TaxID=1280941 RepID=A0A062TZ59_9PROT|nr:hypothetical protein [Hyphomonas pacifica]KCZ45529.1 hypothetical protein HY2_06750 [Hyphomonas pacifica]RAN35701.1 hypothetical protein HY3_07720 [Hyphomonas pacifica]